jgi:hypothetical protein
MHAREGQQHLIEKSRQLQRQLYLAANRSRNRRFHALYDRIFRPDVLWRAWEEVRHNGGSAGVDGVTIEDIEGQGVEEFLQQLTDDLAEGQEDQQTLTLCLAGTEGHENRAGEDRRHHYPETAE